MGANNISYLDEVSTMGAVQLLQDLQDGSLFQLGRGRTKYRSHRPGGSSLLANYLAQIFFGYSEFNH